jgi:threonine synthase
LSADMRKRAAFFGSARADAGDMASAMRWAHEACGQVIDPHTAIGLHAARLADIPADVPVVTLATAHPAKFRDAVEQATGVRPALPGRIGTLFEREERFEILPGDYAKVRGYILSKAVRSSLL